MSHARRRRNEPNPEQLVHVQEINRQRNGRNRSRNRNGFNTLEKIIIVSITLFSIVAMAGFYKWFYTSSFELFNWRANIDVVPDFEKDDRKLSEVIQSVVDSVDEMVLYELELLNFLEGERLDQILKEQLQPVQDRLTSLKTQCGIYEKMDRIPGGPMNFIETSLRELGVLQGNMDVVDTEVVNIVTDERKKVANLRKVVNSVRMKARYIGDIILHPELEKRAIYLVPVTMEEKEVAGEIGKYSLSDITVILQNLAMSLRKEEDTLEKLANLLELLGFSKQNPEGIEETVVYEAAKKMNLEHEFTSLMNENEVIVDKIEELLDDYSIPLMMTLPLCTKLMDNVEKYEDDLGDYATDKRKAFLLLRGVIERDIQGVNTRLHNLK